MADEKGKYDDLVEKVINLLKSSNQVILTGAPGTGKTRLATDVAEKWPEKGCESKKVQFHPGYDYSDFIIGLKPEVDPDHGQVTFKWKNGVFKEFSDEALRAYIDAKGKNAKPYIFIIDEINRADLSRVFGEVFSLLEEDYRFKYDEESELLYTLPQKEEKEEEGKEVKGKGIPIDLPSQDKFILPPNLYIIGTMNDIDRSVESMDFALRRRFSGMEVKAEDSAHIIRKKISDSSICLKLQTAMTELNRYIGGEEPDLGEGKGKVFLNLGEEYKLGGAYFCKYAKYGDNAQELLWENHLRIILNEYLRGRSNREQILKALKGVYDGVWK